MTAPAALPQQPAGAPLPPAHNFKCWGSQRLHVCCLSTASLHSEAPSRLARTKATAPCVRGFIPYVVSLGMHVTAPLIDAGAPLADDNLCVICQDEEATCGFLHGSSVHKCACKCATWTYSLAPLICASAVILLSNCRCPKSSRRKKLGALMHPKATP